MPLASAGRLISAHRASPNAEDHRPGILAPSHVELRQEKSRVDVVLSPRPLLYRHLPLSSRNDYINARPESYFDCAHATIF